MFLILEYSYSMHLHSTFHEICTYVDAQRKVPGSNPGWVITFQRFLCIWVSALCGPTHVWCKFHEMCCADAWIWNILVSGTWLRRSCPMLIKLQ